MNPKMMVTDFKTLKSIRGLIKKSKIKSSYKTVTGVAIPFLTIKTIRDAVEWCQIDPLEGIEEIDWNLPRDDDNDE